MCSPCELYCLALKEIIRTTVDPNEIINYYCGLHNKIPTDIS